MDKPSRPRRRSHPLAAEESTGTHRLGREGRGQPEPTYLLDVNILVALAEPSHPHHGKVAKWFNTSGLAFGVCAFSEAGFVRLAMNPSVVPAPWEANEISEFLEDLENHSGYRFVPVSIRWRGFSPAFRRAVQGFNQIPDAYLLALAVEEDLVLATTDKRLKGWAGRDFSRNLLVLE